MNPASWAAEMLPPLPLLAQVAPLPPLPQTPPPDIPPEVLAWLQTVPPELVLIPVLAVLAIGGSLIFLLVRAIARRIEGKGGKAIQAELAALHERITELEGGQQRIAELEERLEFSERMLVQETRRGTVGGSHAAG